MSRYGTFPYSTGVPYGPTGVALFHVDNFVAKSTSYGAISLSWENPSGLWNKIRLVRSQYGYPATQNDGKVLFTSNSGPHAYGTVDSPIALYNDDGHVDGLRLTPGKTYYYTMWVQYSVGSQIHWARGADAQAIPVTDRGYLDFMLRRLPSIYTNRDTQSDGQPSQQSAGINRFMGILAFDLSRYRDTLEDLRNLNDPDATNGLLLPGMGNQLSYFYEPEIGMRQNRVLLRNATYLGQRKGTALGVLGVVTSVTGWGATLNPLRNLLHDDDDANAKSTTGRWAATGVTLSRTTAIAVPVPTDDAFTQEAGVFVMTATATSGNVSLYDDAPVGKGIPVSASTSYVFSVYLRSATTSRTPTLNIKWYTSGGTLISTSSATSAATSTTAWIRSTAAAVAPATACFATFNINYPTLTVGGVQYFKSVQFEPSKNVLPPSQSTFEDGTTTGWSTSSTGGTLANSSAQAYDGTKSLAATTGTTGAAYVVGMGSGTSGTVCLANTTYTFSIYVRASAARLARARIRLWTASGAAATITTVDGSDSTLSTTGWTRLSVTFTTGSDVAYMTPQVRMGTDTVNGDVYYLDAAQIEVGSAATAFGPEPTAYRPAREVLIDVLPTRINEVQNPSFETDVLLWTATNATLARSTAKSHEGGLASASLVPTANGTVTLTTTLTTLQQNKPVALQCQLLTSTGSLTGATIRADYYNGATLVSSTVGTGTTINATDWTLLTAQGRTPATTFDSTKVTITLPAALAATTYYADDVLCEHDDLIEDYFDHRVESNAFIDGGISIGNGRTYLYPLYGSRFTRALILAQNAVMLGTRVTLRPAFLP